MKTLLLAAIGIIALFAFACGEEDTGLRVTPPPTLTATPTPRPTPTTSPSPTATPAPNVCRPNPDPATPAVLVIDAPGSGEAVRSPITVRGRVSAFEAAFIVTLYNASGNEIVRVNGMSQEGQTLSPSPCR